MVDEDGLPARPGTAQAREDHADDGAARAPWIVLLVLAACWIAALLHRGQPLGWDEIEFFRATKWTGEGRVPFRDFWEHHTPLQWIVFAPVARFFADGPGADAIVTLRWAQAVLWVAMLVLVMRLAKGRERWWALGLLLTSPLFVRSAIEYRVDVLGNFAWLAGIAAGWKRRWVLSGALLSLAVLANMRLVPLVVFSAILFLFRDGEGERWRWNPRALWLLAGVIAVAAPFLGWLFANGAWTPFLEGVAGYNTASAKLLEVSTWYQFAAPFWQRDPAAIVLWGAALAGTILALRDLRNPGLPQFVALLLAGSLVTVALMEVQYEYHFQTASLLMVPMAALAFSRVGRWQWLLVAVAAVSLVLGAIPLASGSFGNELRYQDYVMREADRRTGPEEHVFDGNGYALRREPAYRYWFLTTGVRFLAAQGAIPGYDIAANPPAVVIYNLRVQRWFEIFPESAQYAVRHYVPLTRDLWVPGLSAVLQPGRGTTWVSPAAGEFTLWSSEVLVKHPWFTQPLTVASLQGPRATRYVITLGTLPAPEETLEWTVDGVDRTGSRSVRLKKGSRVTMLWRHPRSIGVLLVPSDVRELCVAPREEFQF